MCIFVYVYLWVLWVYLWDTNVIPNPKDYEFVNKMNT